MSAPSPSPNEETRHERLTRLFEQSAELEPAEQVQFLAELAGDDIELRAELESLLELDEEDDPWLEPAMGLAAQFQQPLRQKGEKIGNYEVERAIGSGGAGDVYLAHQLRPRRLVAIKVMRQGLVDPARVRKFEFEAQLLARLQHAGIAQVFEAGVYEDRDRKMPFFVMEYVENAMTLTAYAEHRHLTLRDRLELFAGVCEAVSHGHQHGISHCDLKPENVLVAPTGAAKVIDFGIARASDHDPNVTTLQTGYYQLAGTLPYMSPEQAGSSDGIDVRTDVYSLGAMLYELLARQLPLDLTGVSIPKATHLIGTVAPTPLGNHGAQLRGDVETIVGKCLEKDRERRYQDAGELARDIRRFLNNEPIHARRPTMVYQLRKFTRRHRGFVFGSALAVLALIVGSAIAVREAIHSAQGEARSRWIAYRASISAAGAALATHDVAQARVNLENAPEEHRNWEWRHLMARLDDSLFALRPSGEGRLGTPFFTTHNGVRTVGVRLGNSLLQYDLQTGEQILQEPTTPMSRDEESQRSIYVTGQSLKERRLVVEEAGEVIFEQHLSDMGFARSFWRWMSIAPGGRYVAVNNTKQVARVDLERGTVAITDVDAGTTGVATACISRSGHVAFAAGVAGRAAIWLADSDKLQPLDSTFGPARSVAFHPTKPRLAIGLQDTTIGIWDVTTRERLVRADGHQHAVTAVAFSNDGKFLYSGSLDRSLRIWRTPKLAPLSTKHGHERGLSQIMVDPVTGAIASSGEKGVLRIWSPHQIRDLGSLRRHDGFVFPVAYSPDGQLMASAGNDGTVRLWATASHELVATLPSPLGAALELAFNATSNRLLAADGTQVVAWDLDGGHRLATVSMKVLADSPRNATFAADGQTLLLPQYHADGHMPGWNFLRNKASKCTVADLVASDSRCVSGNRRFCILTKPKANQGSVSRANSDSGAPLVLIDTSSGTVIETPPISGAFAWIPETTMLCARDATDHSQVLVVDGTNGEVLTTIDGHSDRIYAMTCSPDGTRLCTSGRDGVRLWAFGDAARSSGRLGDRIVELQGHSSFVWSARWRPDGEQIVTGSGDGTVRLWGVDTAKYTERNRLSFADEDQRDLADLTRRLGNSSKVAHWLRGENDLVTPAKRYRLRMLMLSQFSW